MEASPVERSDALLDPSSDPGGAAMGTLGDGSVETNWFVLLHRRVSERAVRSPRYQWWALVALLAGLLSLNITFTVFVVALPTVKADFHTTIGTPHTSQSATQHTSSSWCHSEMRAASHRSQSGSSGNAMARPTSWTAGRTNRRAPWTPKRVGSR